MNKTRLEAFSDGVIAIVITIMVLEFKVPHGEQLADLLALTPVFLSYVLSFVNVGIYWNNHHHLLHAVKRVDGRILWANLHLLFWLSLMPFATAWMGENHFAALPVAVYAIDLLLCALAYTLLQQQIIRLHGRDSLLSSAVGRDLKGKASLVSYALSVPLAFLGHPWFAGALIAAVAAMWLVPDRRIERRLAGE
ncbi:MAG: TMEM175 family protein [Leptothrix sp. (in: b-proteobacteria)]